MVAAVEKHRASKKALEVPLEPERVILIRHAEKPEDKSDPHLTEVGREHAQRLAESIPAKYGVPDLVIAAANSDHSHRPVETAQPLVDKYHLPFEHSIPGDDVDEAAAAIRKHPGKLVLVVWHHETLPALATALGRPEHEQWPDDDFSTQWLITLKPKAVAEVGPEQWFEDAIRNWPESAEKFVSAEDLKRDRLPIKRVTFQGFPISIENPAGTYRVWGDKPDERTLMRFDYGYIRGSLGSDGDHVDVYLGPNENASHVYVVRQIDPDTGAFDEDKCMIGFDSETAARLAFLAHRDDGDRAFGGIQSYPVEVFRDKVRETLKRPGMVKIAYNYLAEKVFQEDQARDDHGRWTSGGGGSVTAYHGSPNKFEQFDESKIGSTTDAGVLGRGIYLTTDSKPAYSEEYHYTAQVDLKNPLKLSYPKWGSDKGAIVREALGLPKSATSQEVTDAAKAKGHDGVILDYSPVNYNSKEICVFSHDAVQITNRRMPEASETRFGMPRPQSTGKAVGFAEVIDALAKAYNEDQPRDEHGRWTSGGAMDEDQHQGQDAIMPARLSEMSPEKAERERARLREVHARQREARRADKEQKQKDAQRIAYNQSNALDRAKGGTPPEFKDKRDEMFGDRPIEIKGDVSPIFASAVRVAYDHSIPDEVKDRLNSAHLGLTVCRNSVAEAIPRLEGQQPRGWPEGSTFNEVGGVFSPSDLTAVVSEFEGKPASENQRVAGTVRHELGHAYDMAHSINSAFREGWASEMPRMEEAYNKDAQAIFDNYRGALPGGGFLYSQEHAEDWARNRSPYGYYLQKGPAGRQEAFAEVFAQMHGTGSTRADVLERFPNYAKEIRYYVMTGKVRAQWEKGLAEALEFDLAVSVFKQTLIT